MEAKQIPIPRRDELWTLTHVSGYERYPFRWMNQFGEVQERGGFAWLDRIFPAFPHEWDVIGPMRV